MAFQWVRSVGPDVALEEVGALEEVWASAAPEASQEEAMAASSAADFVTIHGGEESVTELGQAAEGCVAGHGREAGKQRR